MKVQSAKCKVQNYSAKYKTDLRVKSFAFLVVALSFAFCVLSFVSPVWADCPGVCCDPDNCINNIPETSPPWVCIPDKVCCESCSSPGGEGGITNPVIGLFGTQAGELTLAYILAQFLRLSLVGAGILLLIYLIIAGIQWLTSGGEKTAVASARDRMTNAFIGLVIIVLVIVIINLINSIFKLNILKPELPTP